MSEHARAAVSGQLRRTGAQLRLVVHQQLDALLSQAAAEVAAMAACWGTSMSAAHGEHATSLPPAARVQVRRVAQLFPTAIISGRGREKVQQFVQLAELYYAGRWVLSLGAQLARL